MIFKIRLICGVLLITLLSNFSNAQKNVSFVDKNGILRWSNEKSEIKGFGINYSLPFAHAYRMARRMNINHEEAIKQDIYHFARLDLNFYRVHVWDTEISDSLGNLINHDHLRLFDFTISEMKKRGMKFVITPIAFWGNGWPEKDEKTPGFSNKYGKAACLTNNEAIKPQENYLFQFMNHINRYTGIAYKNDNDIVAIEISNEPHHKGTKENVKDYINRMVKSIRRTGTSIPVFYNMSHSINLVDAYLESDVEGGTFQWYPTGLVASKQIKGNYLPHVINYNIPFAENPAFKKKAKIVYEFDAADIGDNYIYPVMARSFREAGIQLATHFDYDAMFLAPFNTNYGTHYMSLPYSPQKAISLKIASAVFHELPMHKNYGQYPYNNRFGNFRVDYENNLAEFVSDTRFFYTNNTISTPTKTDNINEIAGFGNSPLIKYDGTGAYFIDRIEMGIWRLEIMPDAFLTADPYGPPGPGRQTAAVVNNIRNITINLKDLGNNFLIKGINTNNVFSGKAYGGSFTVSPGVYILHNENSKTKVTAQTKYKNIELGEYVAPTPNLNRVIVRNYTSEVFTSGQPAEIIFEIIAPRQPVNVDVLFTGTQGLKQLRANKKAGNTYSVTLPGSNTLTGTAEYYILVQFDETFQTFPSGLEGKPSDWVFFDRVTYSLRITDETQPLILWNASLNWDKTIKPWNRNINISPSYKKGNDVVLYHLTEMPIIRVGRDSLPIHTFKYYYADDIKGRSTELKNKSSLVINAKSLNKSVIDLEVGLTDLDGRVYAKNIKLNDSI